MEDNKEITKWGRLVQSGSIQVDLLEVCLTEVYPSQNSPVKVCAAEDGALAQSLPERSSHQIGCG